MRNVELGIRSEELRMNKFKNIFSKLYIFSIIFIPLTSILLIIILVCMLSKTPSDTLYYFFIGPFSSIFHFGNMLNSSVPVIVGALGIIIAMKAGSLNLGGEGQVYLGAFVSAVIALHLSQEASFLPAVLAAVIAITAGSLISGAAAAFCGLCKAKWKTNELITSFLLSCAIIPIINYLVTGPFMDTQTSLLSTKKIADNMRLQLILKPSGLNISIYFALVLVMITHFFMYNTKTGYRFRITGLNEMFARYGGINIKINTVLAMALSGFMYGIAGSLVVFGTHYAVIKEFSSGLGWSALTAALFSGFSPLKALPCALFLSWISSGARIATQNTDLAYEIAHIIQAVIFILSTSYLVKNNSLKEIFLYRFNSLIPLRKRKE